MKQRSKRHFADTSPPSFGYQLSSICPRQRVESEIEKVDSGLFSVVHYGSNVKSAFQLRRTTKRIRTVILILRWQVREDTPSRKSWFHCDEKAKIEHQKRSRRARKTYYRTQIIENYVCRTSGGSGICSHGSLRSKSPYRDCVGIFDLRFHDFYIKLTKLLYFGRLGN